MPDEALTHPLLSGLVGLAEGFTAVPSVPGGVALDYIRGNLFDRTAMRDIAPFQELHRKVQSPPTKWRATILTGISCRVGSGR
jgi:hypothetical protein